LPIEGKRSVSIRTFLPSGDYERTHQMNLKKLIPSMFHRRLVLLLFCASIIVLILSGQLYRLSIVEGAERRAEAESKLDRRTFLPTHRGQILDRNGRILARDRASYDIAISYDVITGAWPRQRAASQARSEIGLSRWGTLSPEQREQAIDARVSHWEWQVERIWRALQQYGGLDEAEITRRRDAIRAEVQSLTAVVWDRQRIEWINRFGTADDDDEDDAGFRPRPIREQRQPHVVLTNVDDEIAFHFRRLALEIEGRFCMCRIRARANNHGRQWKWCSTAAGCPSHYDPTPRC
jgi:penicillin-binding protein 2